jgi:hypothetical protein
MTRRIAILALFSVPLATPAMAARVSTHPCFARPYSRDGAPIAGPTNRFRVHGVRCSIAYLAATEYLDSYAAVADAWGAIDGTHVAFSDRHGAWRCTVLADEERRPGEPPLHLSCNATRGENSPQLAGATMSFRWATEPMKACPLVEADTEVWVGGQVTRNASCGELRAFIGTFDNQNAGFDISPTPSQFHTTATWPSLLPNGHGPEQMEYQCAYSDPSKVSPEGWTCNDRWYAFAFQARQTLIEWRHAEELANSAEGR